MGRLKPDQGQLFYSFCLEEVVPDDHQVRGIAAVLDLSWVHAELAPYYPKIGRPSIDPVLMIRMLIIGYVFGIRSERLLCREVKVNMAYRWFCGLSIEDKIPDHSAFSRARNERFLQQRHLPACVRACGAGVHCSRPGRWRGLCGRCQPDRGGRQQAAVDPGQGMGQGARSGDSEPSREGVSGNARRRGLRRGERCHARSSSRRPIRRRNGPAPCADRPSSPMPTTI